MEALSKKNNLILDELVQAIAKNNLAKLEASLQDLPPADLYQVLTQGACCPFRCAIDKDNVQMLKRLFAYACRLSPDKLKDIIFSVYIDKNTMLTAAAANGALQCFKYLLSLDQCELLSSAQMQRWLNEMPTKVCAQCPVLFFAAHNKWLSHCLLDKATQLSPECFEKMLKVSHYFEGNILDYAYNEQLAGLGVIASYYFYLDPMRALAFSPTIVLHPRLCMDYAWENQLPQAMLARIRNPIIKQSLLSLLRFKIVGLASSKTTASTRALNTCINKYRMLGGCMHKIPWRALQQYLDQVSQFEALHPQVFEIAIDCVKHGETKQAVDGALQRLVDLTFRGNAKRSEVATRYIRGLLSVCGDAQQAQALLQQLGHSKRLPPGHLRL